MLALDPWFEMHFISYHFTNSYFLESSGHMALTIIAAGLERLLHLLLS